MMNPIDLHNYEAWFLDYSEGRLSAGDVELLNAFINSHPELRVELEEFENVRLSEISKPSIDWSALKKPNLQGLKEDEAKREELYFRAVEGSLNVHEERMLTVLLHIPAYAKEYALWQKVKLSPGNECIEHDTLYQFGLDGPVDESNFDAYLIALCEGLLVDKQHHALADFAERHPDKLNAMAMAGKLRLQAPTGIFYPDKDKLYRKEQRRILPLWLYRAAAVALLLGLGASLWIGLQDADKQSTAPLAEVIKPDTNAASPADSSGVPLKEMNPAQPEAIFAKPQEVPLQEWEVREPDDALIADATAQSLQHKDEPESNGPVINSTQHTLMQRMEPIVMNLIDGSQFNEGFAVLHLEKTASDENKESPDFWESVAQEDAALGARRSPSEIFQSIPGYAVSALARQLSIEEQERDHMALAIARKMTERASEVLNTEFKKEVSTDSDNLTYMLRVRGFSLTHSRSK